MQDNIKESCKVCSLFRAGAAEQADQDKMLDAGANWDANVSC
jgi:hypothetical protein